MNPNISITVSFFTGVIYHFTLNKFFVFKETKTINLRYQIVQYIILVFINYSINLGIANLFLFLKWSIYVSQVVSIGVTVMLTYFIMNKLIFNKKTDI